MALAEAARPGTSLRRLLRGIAGGEFEIVVLPADGVAGDAAARLGGALRREGGEAPLVVRPAEERGAAPGDDLRRLRDALGGAGYEDLGRLGGACEIWCRRDGGRARAS